MEKVAANYSVFLVELRALALAVLAVQVCAAESAAACNFCSVPGRGARAQRLAELPRNGHRTAVCGVGRPAGRFSRPTRWPVPPRQEGFVVVGVGDGGPRRAGFGALVTLSRGGTRLLHPGRGSGDLPRELNSVDAVAREALTVGISACLADGGTARLNPPSRVKGVA